MTLLHITNKQKEIILLVYQYRFINTKQIQKILKHKDKKTINNWLKDLTTKNYLQRIYSQKLGENIIPAIYHSGLNAIRFFKTVPYCSPNIIRKLYREGKRSEFFSYHCLLIADICLSMVNEKDKSTSYSFQTQSQYYSPTSEFNFLKNLNPDLTFIKQTGSTKKYYLLEVFDLNPPNRKIRGRIRSYKDFYFSNIWEDNTKGTFPTILLVLPTLERLIFTKRPIKKILSEENIENLPFKFTTTSQIKEFGATANIWED